jgi:hypothetical protein
MDLVPADTIVALSARWQEVCKDGQLQKPANAQVINNRLQSFGIEPTSVVNLALFSNRLDAKNNDIGMILSGSYNVQSLLEKAKSQNFTKQLYQGHAIYCNETNSRALCLVKGNLLSIGTRDTVEKTLSVIQSPQKAFVRQPFIRKMMTQSKETNYPLYLFLAMPQEVEDMTNVALHMSSFVLDLAGIGVVGDLLNTIGFAKALSCSLTRRGGRFTVEMIVAMRDENAASLISGSLNLLKRTSNLLPREQMSANDRVMMNRFQDLNVTRNREVLLIYVTIPEEELVR